jgi:hypothetical protein
VCLYRDADVVVTGWSAARIPWPRCRALDGHGGSGSGLLVDEELARAVRNESATAIMFWWGVSCSTVAIWRKALGVGRADSEGSQRLIRAAAKVGARGMQKRAWSPEEREQRRRRAAALDLGRHLHRGYYGRWWSSKEVALLGTLPDEEVARRVRRTAHAVRQKRTALGIASACDRRRGNRTGTGCP